MIYLKQVYFMPNWSAELDRAELEELLAAAEVLLPAFLRLKELNLTQVLTSVTAIEYVTNQSRAIELEWDDLEDFVAAARELI